MFQHTAARRRLARRHQTIKTAATVSTHSRPKAAGFQTFNRFGSAVCFNTQPPEGGWSRRSFRFRAESCFNTQPPEGGWFVVIVMIDSFFCVSTHSRPKAAGTIFANTLKAMVKFQHTAARRRLVRQLWQVLRENMVSTHSRPKAAGLASINLGCWVMFQHTAARRRLGSIRGGSSRCRCVSTHSRPKAAGLARVECR